MKMFNFIKVLDFGYQVPVQLSIHNIRDINHQSEHENILLWKDMTIDMFEKLDDAENRKRKQNLLEEDFNIRIDDIEYMFYYALFSIFEVAGNWLKAREPNFEVLEYAKYYTLIHIPILTEEELLFHDFSEIQYMPELIHNIKRDQILRYEMYKVDVYESMKKHPGECVKIQFGNRRKKMVEDQVCVELFDGTAIVRNNYEINTYLFEDMPLNNVEEKILHALNLWRRDQIIQNKGFRAVL